MKYGLTYGQQHELKELRDRLERSEKGAWRKCFALFPVTLSDGSSIWLEDYWRRERWIECPLNSVKWPGFYVIDKVTT